MKSPDPQIPTPVPPDPQHAQRQGWTVVAINAALYLAATFAASAGPQAPAAAVALIIVVNLVVGVYLALRRNPLGIWFIGSAIVLPVGLLLIGFALRFVVVGGGGETVP